MRRLARRDQLLAVSLAIYLALDILLTPLGGLETRPVSGVTTLGLTVLALLFIGLALAVGSMILLFTRPRLSPILTIIGALLYLPAFLAEQTGLFSSFKPPLGIQIVEIVQALIALISIILALSLRRSQNNRRPSDLRDPDQSSHAA